MRPSDDGMRFHAVLEKADGARQTRETDQRDVLLTWLAQHQRAGDLLVEVGVTATGPAVKNMVAAMRLGAARLAERD